MARPRRRADGATLEHKFFLRVEKTDGCWLWLGPLCERGYGKFNMSKRYVRAHRWIWEHASGLSAAGMDVRHTCDAHYPAGDITNRRCANPAHLELGTHADNMRDMVARKRAASGERVSLAKLSAEQVMAARADRARGATVESLARRYCVNGATMSRALRGETWGHL